MLGRFATADGYRINDQAWGRRSSVQMIGEHSRDLLGELGYDASAIDILIADGVIREET